MTLAYGAREATTAEGTGRQRTFDAAAFLTVWIVLLYGISAHQVVPGFGAIGSPAMIVALAASALWVLGLMHPESGLSRDPHPMRLLLIVYLAFQLLSFAVASSRQLSDLEATGSQRALLTVIAMVGIALLAADGIPTVERAADLLRRLVYAGGIFAAFGIFQLAVRDAVQVSIPGLVWNLQPMGLDTRGPFGRPTSTAMHPIEYSVLAGSLFPLAIYFALYGSSRRRRRLAGASAVALGLAVPLASTRSGLVSLVLGMAILIASWRGRRLVNAIIASVMAVPLVWALIPGVVGAMIGLFTDTDDDVSIQARLLRVPRIMALIRERPVAGLGLGTWSTEDYFLIDNEVWVTTLETGIVGILLTGLILVVGIASALIARSIPGVDEATGQLCQAVAATTAALAVSLLTFDAFHYRILTGTLFLLLGISGALWRIYRGTDHVLGRSVAPREPRR